MNLVDSLETNVHSFWRRGAPTEIHRFDLRTDNHTDAFVAERSEILAEMTLHCRRVQQSVLISLPWVQGAGAERRATLKYLRRLPARESWRGRIHQDDAAVFETHVIAQS